jgi:hypothetical protein
MKLRVGDPVIVVGTPWSGRSAVVERIEPWNTTFHVAFESGEKSVFTETSLKRDEWTIFRNTVVDLTTGASHGATPEEVVRCALEVVFQRPITLEIARTALYYVSGQARVKNREISRGQALLEYAHAYLEYTHAYLDQANAQANKVPFKERFETAQQRLIDARALMQRYINWYYDATVLSPLRTFEQRQQDNSILDRDHKVLRLDIEAWVAEND